MAEEERWDRCEVCGNWSPLVTGTNLCPACCFGEAATLDEALTEVIVDKVQDDFRPSGPKVGDVVDICLTEIGGTRKVRARVEAIREADAGPTIVLQIEEV